MSDFPTVSPFHPLPHQSPPRMAVVSYSLPACRSALTREAGLYPIRIDAKLGRWVKNLGIRSWSFWSPTDFASIYWRSPPQTNITRRTRCFFSILHPLGLWKKNLGFKLPRNISCGSAGDSDLSTHQNGGAPFFQPTPKHHPASRSPRRQVLLPTQTSTHQVRTGSLAIWHPSKRRGGNDPKKKAGKIYVHAWYSRGSLGICQWNAQFIIKFVGYPTYSRNGPLIFSRAPQLKPLAQVKGHTFHLAQRGFEDRLGKVMGFPQGAIS